MNFYYTENQKRLSTTKPEILWIIFIMLEEFSPLRELNPNAKKIFQGTWLGHQGVTSYKSVGKPSDRIALFGIGFQFSKGWKQTLWHNKTNPWHLEFSCWPSLLIIYKNITLLLSEFVFLNEFLLIVFRFQIFFHLCIFIQLILYFCMDSYLFWLSRLSVEIA